ncbi:MAG: NAD-dependent epimerase/dehydratase family protein [Actinomycetota bacterium]|nr:NAD-dependent epimerase/dehydratase family protein [Actinomycetota bacterium]
MTPVLPAELKDRLGGRTALITGGLGFIGSNLAFALVDAGCDVTLVDALVPGHGGNPANVEGLEGAQVVLADLRDSERLAPLVERAELLFNLAGQTSHLDSMENPFGDLELNCGAQLSLLENCRRLNPRVRIVFAGTRQVYGRPQTLPVSEEHPIDPVDLNGIHKLAAEWYHVLYGRVYGPTVSVLRLTNTYGPRMRVRDARQTFLGVWIKQLLTGERIQVYGDGSQRRDFTYVDDAVRALCLAVVDDAVAGEILNVGSREPVSLLELAQRLVELHGGGGYDVVPFPPDRLAIDIGDYFADSSKLEQRLGWWPEVDLDAGLRRTLAYFRAHGERYWGEPE